MKKTYKNYCEDCNTSCKMISGIKNVPVEMIETLSDWQDKQTQDMFRKMTMILQGDIEKHINVEPVFAQKHQELDFASVLLGNHPEWELVKAEVYLDGILFYYYQFDINKDKRVQDWLIISLETPQDITLYLNIEKDQEHPALVYRIRMKETASTKTESITIDYYVNNNKVRFSSLESDEEGVYELIVEI